MRKITICFVCVIAFLCIFTSKSKATMHVAMMDEEYLNFEQQKYDERIKRAKEEEEARKKAEEEKAALEKETSEKTKTQKTEVQKSSKKTSDSESKNNGNNATVAVAKAAAGKFSQKDIDILYKICHAESRGEGEKGQMAVANVILNRVKSSDFPNSIEGVVFQSGQFTPAASGSFNSISPSAQVKESVRKVINGERVFADDVLYFKSVSSSANWGKLEFRVKIGRHLFYAR